MDDDFHLESVDHDPFKEPVGASRTNGHELVPQDQDPFNDPESVRAILQSIVLLEQRIYQMEIGIAHAMQQIHQTQAHTADQVAGLHYAHENLRQTFSRPRRVERDDEGRISRLTIEHEPIN